MGGGGEGGNLPPFSQYQSLIFLKIRHLPFRDAAVGYAFSPCERSQPRTFSVSSASSSSGRLPSDSL